MGPLYGTFPRAVGSRRGVRSSWGVGSRWEVKPFWSLQQIHYHKNGLKVTQKWGNIMKHQSILKDRFTGHIRVRSMINMVTHQCVHKTLHLVNDTPSTKSIQKHFNYINPSIWTTPTLIKCRSWPCCLPGLRPTNGIKQPIFQRVTRSSTATLLPAPSQSFPLKSDTPPRRQNVSVTRACSLRLFLGFAKRGTYGRHQFVEVALSS